MWDWALSRPGWQYDGAKWGPQSCLSHHNQGNDHNRDKTKTKAKTGIKKIIMSVIRAKVLIMTRTMDNGHDQGSTFRLVFSHPEQTQDHILQARRLLFFNQRHKCRKIECFVFFQLTPYSPIQNRRMTKLVEPWTWQGHPLVQRQKENTPQRMYFLYFENLFSLNQNAWYLSILGHHRII